MRQDLFETRLNLDELIQTRLSIIRAKREMAHLNEQAIVSMIGRAESEIKGRLGRRNED